MTCGYDPSTAPDPDAWLELEEFERFDQVLEFHRDWNVEPRRQRLHAAIHVMVENQVAIGEEIPVAATLDRLMDEGLDRHEAVHAVGTVLIGHIQTMMNDGLPEGDPNVPYHEVLGGITAEDWRRGRI